MAEEINVGEKTRTETEWKGLMTDKQSETRARQQIQSELAVKNLKLTELEGQIQELMLSSEGNGKDLNETVTRAELLAEKKKTKQELMDLHKAETVKSSEVERTNFVNKSFTEAIKKHTVEKDGKGLSFDDVMEGTKRQISENSTNRTLIENDTNPGEKAYQIGLQDPVIAERHEMYKKTLAERKKIPKVGMEGTLAPEEIITQERLLAIPAGAEREKFIKDHYEVIQASQKTWEK
ncbi:MAG: hypothetical protein Q7J67_00520 [bacterium]|nr:hypothetical protein [bacterium]